jgi:hypothetical protein
MQLLSSALRAIWLVPGLIVLEAPRRELQFGSTRNIDNEKDDRCSQTNKAVTLGGDISAWN